MAASPSAASFEVDRREPLAAAPLPARDAWAFARRRLSWAIAAGVLVTIVALFVTIGLTSRPGSPLSFTHFDCTDGQVSMGCTKCTNEATCSECIAGRKLKNIDYRESTICYFPCTQEQQYKGCDRCANASSCIGCIAGHVTETVNGQTVCRFDCLPQQTNCSRCDNATSCTACNSGFELERRSNEQACQFVCTAAQRQNNCSRCANENFCLECDVGYKVQSWSHIGGLQKCHFMCTVPGTDVIIEDTNWPQGACKSCLDSNATCETNQCREGYLWQNGKCVANGGPKLLDFYVYRAVAPEPYVYLPWAGVNMASAAGVMSYMHVEVIPRDALGGCERKYNIQKIQRWRVKVKNTPMVNKVRNGQFGHFMAFDLGRCTFDFPTFKGCRDNWRKFGYNVGCQKRGSNFHYPEAYWYSAPGPCPDKQFADKDANCTAHAPGGGNCQVPDGTPFCTWKSELAGEVTVDELVGICTGKDCIGYKDFCKAGKVEWRSVDYYKNHGNAGLSIDFWKNYDNEDANRARTQALIDLFERNYPGTDRLATPDCDGW